MRIGHRATGGYAVMSCRLHDRRANTALLDWIHEHGLPPASRPEPNGDHFSARAGVYLTDPCAEPRATHRIIELNLLLADISLT